MLFFFLDFLDLLDYIVINANANREGITMLNRTIIKAKDFWGGEYYESDPPKMPQVNDTYFVWEREYVGPNKEKYFKEIAFSIDRDLIENGMGGNMNPNIKSHHGWRGTTDDVCVTALGVRKCLESSVKQFKTSTHYRIRFGTDQIKD